MWPLALTVLTALAALANAECPASFEPHHRTARRLERPGMTWREAAMGCDADVPGFGMLGRGFLELSKTDRSLCGDRLVPLGLKVNAKGVLIWDTSCPHCFEVHEEVNSTFLSLMQPSTTTATSSPHRVGALNLTNNTWRLVAENTTFSCAICTPAWRSYLGQFNKTVPDRPKPYLSAYTFSLKQAGHGKFTVDEAIKRAAQHFNRSAVEFEVMDGDSSKARVRLKVNASSGVERQVRGAFNSSEYVVSAWQDTGWCPAEKFDGFDWPGELVESTHVKSLANFHVVARRCFAKTRNDGDFDAVWEKDVSFWIDRGAECNSQPALNIMRDLQNFAARPPSNLMTALKSFAVKMAAIPKLKPTLVDDQTFYPPRSSLTTAILAALSSLFAVTEQRVDGGHYCTKSACVVVTGDLQSPNNSYEVTLKDTGAPSVFRNHSNTTRPVIALRIPSQSTSSGRVALYTTQARNVKEAPLFKAIHNLVIKAKMAAVVYVASSTPVDAGAWPVSFEVDNTNSRYIFERYFAVWRLGDSEASTLPCPLTKIVGHIDTFSCVSFSSDVKNVTTGSFLVYHDIDQVTDLFRYAERILLGYRGTTIDGSALKVFAEIINKLVLEEKTIERRAKTSSTVILSNSSALLVEGVLSGVVLTEPVFTASLEHVKVLVSDLTVNDPVLGMSFDTDAVHTITAGSKNVSDDTAVDVTLCCDGSKSIARLEILTVTGSTSLYNVGSQGTYIARKLLVVSALALPERGLNAETMNPLHLEIKVDKVRLDAPRDAGGNRALQIAAWSETAGDWTATPCVKRRSTSASKQVFQCDLLELADGALSGRYLVFEPSNFVDALGEQLVAVLIAAGVLSGVSLASIAATAAFLPVWRKDVGHKILLQMTLALSFNLALGFTSSFVSVDTASVDCIAVGIFRHFSYLAMFAWMLVMSSLQLIRLFSVLGARSTPKLLIKVSFFAWGVPILAVVSLLVFNMEMYQLDAADRGYCYPEGTAFTWSVQAPAATVLALNAFIFLVILARLYGFSDWSDTGDSRRHLNERTFQMRRLRAVFFTFCLFGITWLFHLLAEQGVFQTKYQFEYLFLITASVHVFSLSCIFVFFNRNTRAEWRKVSPLSVVNVNSISLRERSS